MTPEILNVKKVESQSFGNIVEVKGDYEEQRSPEREKVEE